MLGLSVARRKMATFCGLPSSRMLKSFLVRLVMGSPFLSWTLR